MKERLDVLLVKRGLAPSREKAKAMIMAGNVFVDGLHQEGGHGRVGQTGHCLGTLGRLHAEQRETGQCQQEQAHTEKNRCHRRSHLRRLFGW